MQVALERLSAVQMLLLLYTVYLEVMKFISRMEKHGMIRML
jgi:hypothetical protein